MCNTYTFIAHENIADAGGGYRLVVGIDHASGFGVWDLFFFEKILLQ